MFASYFAYQLIDFALALFGMRLVLKFADGERARRRFATPLRRFLFAGVPAALAGFALFALLCLTLLHHVVGALGWQLQHRPISITFLGIGAAFYAGLLLVPLVAVWRAQKRARLLALTWLAASVTLMGWMMFVEPDRIELTTTEVALAKWPADAKPLRIVILSDIQTPLTTERERRIPALVQSLAPDLIVLPGDLAGQSFDDTLPAAAARAILSQLSAPLGIYAVNGDVDCFTPGGLEAIVAGTTTRALSNEWVRLDGTPVELFGADFNETDPLATAIAKPPLAPIRIAFVHRPDFVDTFGPAGFDLVIAGHTHGGQVVLPWIGPPITKSGLPRAIAAGGLHPRAGTLLYVSRGVGMEAGFAPPMRLNCRPEIALLIVRGPR